MLSTTSVVYFIEFNNEARFQDYTFGITYITLNQWKYNFVVVKAVLQSVVCCFKVAYLDFIHCAVI